MYTPRTIFSHLLFLHVLSLYTLGRLVTLSCEISDQSPITCVNGHYRVRGSVYIHNVNPKMRLKDMAMWIYKMAARYNRKWRCSIRRPRKPHARTKHDGARMTRCRVMAIWSLPICVNGPLGRSFGRRYSYFLHWSHILLFRYIRNVAREE